MQASSKLAYRPEIDGLRAVAVLAVMIYHAGLFIDGIPLMASGYLGVDIFFVISGYLITSLILKELSVTGKFSFLHFYERRARRLLPALLVVLLVTLPVAWWYLLPTQLIDLVKSLSATLVYGSNYYWFIAEQEYGAESALLQPLLHTWSLAVEEQFYIVFPVLVVVLHRWLPRFLPFALIGIFLSSLYLSEQLIAVNPDLAFYSLHTRGWELMAGAILAYAEYRDISSGRVRVLHQFAAFFGLCAVLLSFFVLGEEYSHPSIKTLIPVAGTVLVVLCAREKGLVKSVLSSRLLAGCGLISYSLYLWHYPVFAFSRIAYPDAPESIKVAWFLLTFFLSILTYAFIEKPFRSSSRTSRGILLGFLLAATSVLVVYCVSVVKQDGFKSRFESLYTLYGKNEMDYKINHLRTYQPVMEAGGSTNYKQDMISQRTKLWFSNEPGTVKVLVIGNSHGRNLFNAFYLNRELFPDYEFAYFQAQVDHNSYDRQALIRSPNFRAAQLVVISSRYNKAHSGPKNKRRNDYRELPRFIDFLLSQHKEVVVVSKAPEFRPVRNRYAFDWFVRNNSMAPDSKDRLAALYFKLRMDIISRDNQYIRQIAEQKNVPLWDRGKLVCHASKKRCVAVTPEGYRIYYDSSHWTLEGARYIGKIIHREGWLQKAIQP